MFVPVTTCRAASRTGFGRGGGDAQGGIVQAGQPPGAQVEHVRPAGPLHHLEGVAGLADRGLGIRPARVPVDVRHRPGGAVAEPGFTGEEAQRTGGLAGPRDRQPDHGTDEAPSRGL